MYMLEKTRREHRFPGHPKIPSFSSTLLDKIYRSIEESERESVAMNFSRETTTPKKHSRSNGRWNRAMEEEKEEDVAKANLRRACLIEKWMEKKANEKVGTKGTQRLAHLHTKLYHHLDHDHDQDVVFFSSTSSSSDSSSGGFSSSDTDSMYGARSQSSCLGSPRPKPVRTSTSVKSDRSEKKERRQNAVFQQQREQKLVLVARDEEGLIRSKSRALKIYENIKKSKQPISPGGRLTNFLNSLFTNTKKSKSTCSVGGCEDVKDDERKSKTEQASTCSSASSFSRSCLSKTSPSLRKDRVKRTVRFYPVSMIVDEDSPPCREKCLYEEEDSGVSVPTTWKIGGSATYKKNDEEIKVPVIGKSRRAEEAAREFLKEHRQNQKKSDLILSDIPIRTNGVEDEDEDEDDAASYSSSDLFELDHSAFMGNGRYSEELPVYETTHVSTNRAIAHGLIM